MKKTNIEQYEIRKMKLKELKSKQIDKSMRLLNLL